MKSWLLLPLIALSSPALAQVAAPQPTPAPITPAQPSGRTLLTATQALFDGYVRDDKMPGIVAAFGVGDRPPVYVQAGRIADEATAPATGPDSLWRVYSMTKPITGMAAMLLIEEGKLKLDDPVSQYIPAFAKMRVLTNPQASLDSVPAKTPITIRHLLTHTAGLSYSIVAKGPLLAEYERLGLLPLEVNGAAEAKMKLVRPKTLAEFANRVATVPLIAEPGTTWSYSVALDVLARVIEVAGGMPYDQFLQTRFFTPLKMADTGFFVPTRNRARLATNYTIIGEQRVPLDPGATSIYLSPPSFPYGGAGLVSSAHDYDRFLHMVAARGTVDGVQVMKPETVALATSNLLPPGVFFEGDQGYGAGGSVRLTDKPGGSSKGTYAWGGAAGTLAWVDPVRNFRATVMVNYFPGTAYPLASDVGGALLQDMQRLHGGNPPR